MQIFCHTEGLAKYLKKSYFSVVINISPSDILNICFSGKLSPNDQSFVDSYR